jgi:hypothetical protein
MKRAFLTAVVFALAVGVCSAQGVLDSVFGPSGLGIWNSGPGNSAGTDYFQPQQQQAYPGTPGGPQYPQQPQPYAQNAPQGQQPQGVYADWYNQPPAQMGGEDYQQGQYPQAQQQYYPPQQQAYPQPQGQAQPAPVQPQPTGARRPVRATVPPQPNPQAQQPTQPYYAGPQPLAAEDLPAGSVRMTTTTPEGTTVQFYPPNGEYVMPKQPQPAQVKPKRVQRGQARQAQPQPGQAAVAQQEGNIPMPKPVAIPQAQDPRLGFAPAPQAPGQ